MATKGRALLLKIGVASVFVLAQSAVPSVAGTSVGSGVIDRFSGVQVTSLPDYTCTSSASSTEDPFEDMAGMALKLRTGGPIVVMFQGQFGGFESTPDARAILRIVVDGEIVGSAVAIGSDVGGKLLTFGFNAFSRPLRPGRHEVKVLWHTFPEGSTSCVEERSLIVLHR
jgi:hypothetical protein